MSQTNELSLHIPEEDVTEIKGAINLLKEKLTPHLLNLSPEDRRDRPKMGEKTIDFVQKALEFCGHNSELVPPFLEVDEFDTDVKAVLLLRDFLFPLRELLDSLEDSLLLAGSEAYLTALMFYGTIKTARKSRVQNAETIYAELSSRFPRGRRRITADEQVEE